MPRDHARINLAIWTDPEFRALPQPAQHLYFILWTHPELSYCGAIDWRPGKLSGLTGALTRADIETAAACLEARHFIVIDNETEELLVRSWIRWDGLMKQPRMAVSCVSAYAALGSEKLRRALVHELASLRTRSPELRCWHDERVADILSHPATSAKDMPTPNDPFGGGFAPELGPGLPQTQSEVCTPPTPSPSPTPTPSSPAFENRRRPERPLPADWEPNDAHRAYAKERGLDLAKEAETFQLHARSNDRRLRDWDSGFRMWLSKARPRQTVTPGGKDLTNPENW